MGGDDFNKSDKLNDFVGFAPVAKKQDQMNAEHASWLQEYHHLNLDSELFNSISKKIIEAASKGLSTVYIQPLNHVSLKLGDSSYQCIEKNGFNAIMVVLPLFKTRQNWNLIGDWESDGGLQKVTTINISW